MIHGLFNHGAMPALERLLQFTGQRHTVLVNNVANLSTSYFKPRDLDPKKFQAAMRRAIDQRRASATPFDGALDLQDTREIRFEDNGIDASPRRMNQNILFHDRNNRDLERIMADLAENTMAHTAGIELLKSEFDLLQTAISERV